VLSGISLSIAPAEVVALDGPWVSGKSTLAQIAAGLLDAREGRVTRGHARHAMVFQDPRLLPWATAGDNIAFPLRRSGFPRGDWPARVARAAAMAELEPADLGKYPVELSGGMRQRVAIARALVVEPDFVFFDEPFTALDVALKRRMQAVTALDRTAPMPWHVVIVDEGFRLFFALAALTPPPRRSCGWWSGRCSCPLPPICPPLSGTGRK
jgi:NitT/TauT family transport system ATP-binding protein